VNYLAIGGLKYSIAKWLPRGWPHYDIRVFGQPTVVRAIEYFISMRSSEQFTLVGFSRGATFALEIAERNRNVVAVYAHSCLRPQTEPRRRDLAVVFFRTIRDQAPGVFEETYEVCQLYKGIGAPTVLWTLPPMPFPKPLTMFERGLARMNHQFHNAVPTITSSIAASK